MPIRQYNQLKYCIALFTVSLCLVVCINAQTDRPPDPEAVKRRILQRLLSDSYLAWNYSINGVRPPGLPYPGAFEGGPPDPVILERNLKANLLVANETIAKEPPRADFYDDRGKIYLELYEITENLESRADYAERALRDFAKAISLDPMLWTAWEHRARLLSLIDFFSFFDAINSDYLQAFRLLQVLCKRFPLDCSEQSTDFKRNRLEELSLRISVNHWKRARALSSYPELLAEVRRLNKQYSKYSYWKDFDTAIAYAQKAITKPSQVLGIINYLIDKGDAAYRLGKYKLALEAYDTAKGYWNKKSDSYCASFPTRCELDKKITEQALDVRKTRVLLKLEKWLAAIPYINRYMSDPNKRLCPEPFLVRARIYRQIGKNHLAMADEQAAKELQNPEVSCYNSVQIWEGLY